MSLPVASLSLDFDNQWSYLKTRGDERWATSDSYLGVLVPRVLEVLDGVGLPLTAFLVGADAECDENQDAIAQLVGAHCEIANHSYHHEPWLHRYSPDQIDEELERSERAISAATGTVPRGFRGPGYSLSGPLLEALVWRGYRYDASTLPTYLGPLARAFYFRRARLDDAQRDERSRLFGTWADGRRPVGPYWFQVGDDRLLELPVTVCPGIKLPMHVSYLLYLSRYSQTVAETYLRSAMRACALGGIGPSLLLHPLDFLSGRDVPALGFFPGMDVDVNLKLQRVRRYLQLFAARFSVLTVGEHAAVAANDPRLAQRRFGNDEVPANLAVAR